MKVNEYSLSELYAFKECSAFDGTVLQDFLFFAAIQTEARAPSGCEAFVWFKLYYNRGVLDIDSFVLTPEDGGKKTTKTPISKFVRKLPFFERKIAKRLCNASVIITDVRAVCKKWRWRRPRKPKPVDLPPNVPRTLFRSKEWYILKLRRQMGKYAKKLNIVRYVCLADNLALVSVRYSPQSHVSTASGVIITPYPEQFAHLVVCRVSP